MYTAIAKYTIEVNNVRGVVILPTTLSMPPALMVPILLKNSGVSSFDTGTSSAIFLKKIQISASPKRRMKLNPKRKKEFCHRLPKQSLTQ